MESILVGGDADTEFQDRQVTSVKVSVVKVSVVVQG